MKAAFFLSMLFVAAQNGKKSSRELAIEVDKALQADPSAYPKELVDRCVAAATAELKACKPDPAVVAKLVALPENTWLDMNQPESKATPENHHSFPRGRGEGSACCDGSVKGVVCYAGCGAPQYSCDLWVYKTGANRWFEVWPNIPRNYRVDMKGHRPPAGCTLGLAYAEETGCTYRFTCANTGEEGRNIWETNILSSKWQVVGRNTKASSAEGLRIAYDSVLRGFLTVCDAGPLIHLHQLRCLDLLSAFESVLAPEGVFNEVQKHAVDFPAQCLGRRGGGHSWNPPSIAA